MHVQPCIKASIIKFLPGSLLCLAPHLCLTYSHLLSFSHLCLNPSHLKCTNLRSKPRFCLFSPPFLQAVFSVEVEANQRLEISLQQIQFCGTSWNNDTKRLYKETSSFCAGRDNEQMIPQLLVCSSPPVREHVFWANYALCKQSFTYLNIKNKTKPPQLCITSPDKQERSSAYDINIYFCRAIFWPVFFSHWCLRIIYLLSIEDFFPPVLSK